MAQSGNKTVPREGGVEAFLSSVTPPKRAEDCRAVMAMMASITGEPPVLWGTSIIGFGQYHYRYDSGREGDSMLTGVSPRKASLSIYIMGGFEQHAALLDQLGKHKTGKACLYINKLEDIHRPTLEKLVRRSVRQMRKKYGVQ